jgi:PAS domain
VLAVEPGQNPRFRVAGTKVCGLFGRELRGDDFMGLWGEADARQVREIVAHVINEGIGVLAGAATKAGDGLVCPLELGSFLRNYCAWKLRVYRAVWNIICRTWKAERWIRVNSADQDLMQWIQLNGTGLDEYGRPIIINKLGALNVEISMDEGPDVANLMQDAYEIIKDDPTIPWQIKLEFMPLPASMKKTIEQKLQQAQQQQPPDPKVQAAQLKMQSDQQSAQQKLQQDQQKGQFEVHKAALSAQAEEANAQQDAQSRNQDAALEHQRMLAEQQRIAMEMEQSRQEHAFKMAELGAQHATRQAEHAAKLNTTRQMAKIKVANAKKPKAA